MLNKNKSSNKIKIQKSKVCNEKETMLANNHFANQDTKSSTSPRQWRSTFSKPTKKNNAWFYTDGKEYFSDIYDRISALESGSTIYITDWGMNIDFYLKKIVIKPAPKPGEQDYKKDKKNDHNSHQAQLDKKYQLLNLLKEAALRDIHINILLWDSAKKAFDTRDLKNEAVLESILGNNKKFSKHIRVMRHRPSPVYTHHQKSVILVNPTKKTVTAYLGGLDLFHGRWDTGRHRLADPEGKFFPSDEYVNPLIKSVNRKTTPRMPWHDVHMGMIGPAAREVERNFVERWNSHNSGLGTHNWDEAENDWEDHLKKYITNFDNRKKEFKYIEMGQKEDFLKLSDFKLASTQSDKTIQVLRTITRKLGGLSTSESSIYEVFKKLITHSKHYVYIESQYLVGSYSGNANNKILETLVNRIIKAYKANEKAGKIVDNFRAYIVFPVTPDGPTADSSTGEFMYWQWQTIHRDTNYWDGLQDNKWGGMMGALEKGIGKSIGKIETKGSGEDQVTTFKPEEGFTIIARYLKFFNLRAHDKLDGNLITEQIYIHSKMLIVDDRYAVIGSANINDRSMIVDTAGDTDSEIAALVVDNEIEDVIIDGKPACARKFARDLRMRLWNEHVGLHPGSMKMADPVSDETHGFLSERADINTHAFESAFPGIPSNLYPNIEAQTKARKTQKQTTKEWAHVRKIKGHLVNFPLLWLWTDDITIQDVWHPDYFYARATDSTKNNPAAIAATSTKNSESTII